MINIISESTTSKKIIVFYENDRARNDLRNCASKNECADGNIAMEANVPKCNNCVNLQSELLVVK